MLEGFKVIKNKSTLKAVEGRMDKIQKKLLGGKHLTEEEEKKLKLYLWSMEGLDREFKDDDHRLQLIDQWQREAKLWNEKLLKEEK